MKKINSENIIIGFLFLLTILLTLLPFFSVGITCSDDLEYYFTFQKGNLFADAQNYARVAGRFYFLITKPIYSLVYAFDNFYVTKIIQHSALLFSYIIFSCLIKKVTKSIYFALFIFLLLLLATPCTVNWHMPFIAYPFFFTFSFGLMCCALILYIKFLEDSSKYKYLILSAILWFIVSLFYETYILFLLYFCIYIAIKGIFQYGIKKIFVEKQFLREIIPFAVAGLLYMTIYCIYRSSVDNVYNGSAIATNFKLKNFFIVLSQCKKGALPMRAFLYGSETISYALLNATWLVYINALIQCVLTWWLFCKDKLEITRKKFLIILGGALFVAYTAHTLIGIAEKYNSDWYSYMRGYVTTYYSYFGIMLAIGIILSSLNSLFSESKILQTIVRIVSVASVFVVSVVIGYNNDKVSHNWARSQKRFDLVDDMIKRGAFDNIPDNAILYDVELYDSGEGGTGLWWSHKWTEFINIKSGRKIKEDCKTISEFNERLKKDTLADVYVLHKKHTVKENEFLIALSKVKRNTIAVGDCNPLSSATCDSANIFYYSPTKMFSFSFKTQSKGFAVLNTDTLLVEKGYNVVNIKNKKHDEGLSQFCIKCNNLFANSFSISNMVNVTDTLILRK